MQNYTPSDEFKIVKMKRKVIFREIMCPSNNEDVLVANHFEHSLIDINNMWNMDSLQE